MLKVAEIDQNKGKRKKKMELFGDFHFYDLLFMVVVLKIREPC